jgi:hypothetical protein
MSVQTIVASVLAGRLAPYTGDRSVKSHIGHVAGGGIQAHSCGPTFPFYVLGIGDYVGAFDPENGLVGCLYPASLRYAYASAEDDCRIALDGGEIGWRSLRDAEAEVALASV